MIWATPDCPTFSEFAMTVSPHVRSDRAVWGLTLGCIVTAAPAAPAKAAERGPVNKATTTQATVETEARVIIKVQGRLGAHANAARQ